MSVGIKKEYQSIIDEVYIPSEWYGIEVTKIGSFRGCSRLRKVVMPDSITLIYANAFRECSSLSDIIISNNLKYLQGAAFMDCASLTHIDLPQSLEYIGGDCFVGCTNLKELTIPENVNKIAYSDQSPFENSGITRVIFKNPDGWYQRQGANGALISKISSDILSDPEKAYERMVEYYSYTFYRE